MVVQRKYKTVICFLFVAIFLLMPLSKTHAASTPIVLKGITPWVMSYYWCNAFLQFQQMVNTRLKGKLRIVYLGANEVISTFEQFEGLRNGVVDMALANTSYYTGTIPEALAVLYTKLPPSELRKNGYYKIMRDLHLKKGNVIYLANTGGHVGNAYRLFTNVKVDKPDFKGLKFRVTPVYVALIKALGGTPLVMPPSELYTAIERKVIDGYGWSYGGIMDYGWHEVTKYVIDHPFYSANTSICFNADVWKKLPKDIRDELEKIGADLEKWADVFMAQHEKKEDEILKGVGIKSIKFNKEDAKFFVDTAYEEGWKEFIKKHPKIGPVLRKLSG